MPIIKTDNYEGGDRRNCGKLKFSITEWIKIISIVGAIIIGGITFYISTNNNLKLLADDSENNKVCDRQQDRDILTLQNDVSTIKSDVACIKKTQDEGNRLLYQILGKLEESDRHRP